MSDADFPQSAFPDRQRLTANGATDGRQSLSNVHPDSAHSAAIHGGSFDSKDSLAVFPCHICQKPIPLEDAKTDENGKAVHDACYVADLELKHSRMLHGSQIPLRQS